MSNGILYLNWSINNTNVWFLLFNNNIEMFIPYQFVCQSCMKLLYVNL